MTGRTIPQIPVVDSAVPIELFSIFNGGLNTRDKPEELLPNESPDLLNVEATADGAITTARGYVELGEDEETGKTTGLMSYRTGATRHLIKATALLLRKWDGSTWSTVKTHTGTTPTSVSGAMAGGALYIVDGVHTAQKYSGGASTSDVAAIPLSSFITYLPQVDRLVSIEVANPSRIRFSDSGAYETWPAVNAINVADDDGTDIQGVVAYFGPLLILKALGGSGKFSWDGLTFATTGLRSIYGAGAANPKAVAVIPHGGLAFANREGVWLNTGGGQQDVLISDKVTPTIQGMTAGQTSKLRLHWFENKLFFSLPLDGATENSAILVLDFSRNPDGSFRGWYRLDWGASEFCTFQDSNGNWNLIMGATGTGKAYRRYRADEDTDVWNKDGASMTSYWSSAIFQGNRKAKLKDFKRLVYSFNALPELSLKTNETAIIRLSYRADDSDSWRNLIVDIGESIDLWEDSGTWGEDGDVWPGLGKITKVIEEFFFSAKSIQFRTYKAGIDTPFTFYGLAYEEEEKERYS
jgi:hypothetical protein